MNRKTIVWISLFTFILLGFAPSLLAQKQQAPKPDAKPLLPNLVLSTIDGQEWSLHENRGRIVLINFWATWCEPCRTETPMLVELGKEYKLRGLEIVGVALDKTGTETIRKFVAEYKVDYPILLPVPGSMLAQIDPVPTTLLVDAEGRLAKKYVGLLPEKILRADLEKLLEEKPSKK